MIFDKLPEKKIPLLCIESTNLNLQKNSLFFFRILWNCWCHILVTFPTLWKRICFILRFSYLQVCLYLSISSVIMGVRADTIPWWVLGYTLLIVHYLLKLFQVGIISSNNYLTQMVFFFKLETQNSTFLTLV